LRGIGSMDRAAFVIVSAYDRQHVFDAASAQPPDGVLQKPVTPATLLDALQTVLSRHRRQGDRRPIGPLRPGRPAAPPGAALR
jgi:DNA-binding NarL/FixJ family response regulator